MKTTWKAVKKTPVISGLQEAGLIAGNAEFDEEEIVDDPETDDAEYSE